MVTPTRRNTASQTARRAYEVERTASSPWGLHQPLAPSPRRSLIQGGESIQDLARRYGVAPDASVLNDTLRGGRIEIPLL